MKFDGQVLEVRPERFEGKKGPVEIVLVSMLDLGPAPMRITVDWEVPRDVAVIAKVRALKEGEKVTLGVRDVRPAFGGRIRLYGDLIAK